MSKSVAAGGIGFYSPTIEIFNVTIVSPVVSSGYLHFKVPKDITFGVIKAQIFEKGATSSGFLEIDIKKGPTPDNAGMASIFLTKPITNFSTNSDYQEFAGVLSSTTASKDSYLRLDFTQIPAGFIGALQVIAYAE